MTKEETFIEGTSLKVKAPDAHVRRRPVIVGICVVIHKVEVPAHIRQGDLVNVQLVAMGIKGGQMIERARGDIQSIEVPILEIGKLLRRRCSPDKHLAVTRRKAHVFQLDRKLQVCVGPTLPLIVRPSKVMHACLRALLIVIRCGRKQDAVLRSNEA